MSCKLDDLEACRRLVASFAWAVDRADYATVVAQFTGDGVFERPGLKAEGRDQILAAMQARPADRLTRHLCDNLVVEMESDSTASGRCYVTMFAASRAASGEPQTGMELALVGEYFDRFERTPEGWRIAHRRAEIVAQG